jgi:Flp pilus assembly pilin Flp
MARLIRKIVSNDLGSTAVDYAFLMGMIAAVSIATITALGSEVSSLLIETGNALSMIVGGN